MKSGKNDIIIVMKECYLYEKLKDSEGAAWRPYGAGKKVQCQTCAHQCVIRPSNRGICGVRENKDGKLYLLVYGRAIAVNIDPIEKKPLFHFLPGTTAFSMATAGCNVNCKFCQNWQISQVTPEQVQSIDLPPKQLVNLARRYNCLSIAYTYNEPTIFYEYMFDTAVEGRKKNIKSVVITAAYISEQPLKALCENVDAVKVDLKAFTEKYYKEIVNGELKPVLDALITIRKSGVWSEIVYLVVPTLNDAEEEIRGLSRWIAKNLGLDVPIHFTRFHPQYLLKNLPPTPLSTLERCKAIAEAEGLHYVYIGNVPGHEAENTFCPSCGNKIITRTGFMVREKKIKNGCCAYCATKIPGVWQ